MSTKMIAQAAQLDIEGWLDTGHAFKLNDRARFIHADLMTAANTVTAGSKREMLIQRINTHADEVLRAATRAVTVLQNPQVVFAFEVPGSAEEPTDIISGPFVEVNFVDPLEALRALEVIRSQPPMLQMAAMHLLQARFKMLQASQVVGIATLTGSDRANFWPEGDGDKPPKLLIGESNSERRLSLKDHEQASLSRALRNLGIAERMVVKLTTTVPAPLRHLCVQTVEALQCQGSRWPPLAIGLSQDFELHGCVDVARGYDILASALNVNPTLEIQGPMKRIAMAARDALNHCVLALHVIAGWIRALAELKASPQCEFCHRHRAGKKRCAVHLVKDYVTKEARLAIATRPLYVKNFTELARIVTVRWALVRSLQVDAAAQSNVDEEVRAYGVPNELVWQVSILTVQLRRLHPVLGPVLEIEVASLFQKLLVLAIEAFRRPLGRTFDEDKARHIARNESKALLTLRGFLVVWCSAGRPFPNSFRTLVAEGHDAAHPIVRDEPMVESEIALGFLRQRAWIEAEAELRRHTEIDRGGVMDMRARGMSFDAIALVYGCSHDTIAKIVASGAAPKKRARLAGYVAKSRLGASKTESVLDRGRL